MAYISGGGLPFAAIADLIAGIIDRYVTVWVAASGLIQQEQNTIDWMANLIGYDSYACIRNARELWVYAQDGDSQFENV